MATTETQVVAELGSDYKYGFHDPEEYFFKSGRGLSPEVVAMISEHKNEPGWMRDRRTEGARVLPRTPITSMGWESRRNRLREHVLLHPADREAGQVLGGPAGKAGRMATLAAMVVMCI